MLLCVRPIQSSHTKIELFIFNLLGLLRAINVKKMFPNILNDPFIYGLDKMKTNNSLTCFES